jgi:transposase
MAYPHIEAVLPDWSLAPVVSALQALRGMALVGAATLVAELGDITRFANPRQLMAYLGLVPSEHSSGSTRRQGVDQGDPPDFRPRYADPALPGA